MPEYVYYFKKGDIYKAPIWDVNPVMQGGIQFAYSTWSESFFAYKGSRSYPISVEEAPNEFKTYLMLEGFPL